MQTSIVFPTSAVSRFRPILPQPLTCPFLTATTLCCLIFFPSLSQSAKLAAGSLPPFPWPDLSETAHPRKVLVISPTLLALQRPQ